MNERMMEEAKKSLYRAKAVADDCYYHCTNISEIMGLLLARNYIAPCKLYFSENGFKVSTDEMIRRILFLKKQSLSEFLGVVQPSTFLYSEVLNGSFVPNTMDEVELIKKSMNSAFIIYNNHCRGNKDIMDDIIVQYSNIKSDYLFDDCSLMRIMLDYYNKSSDELKRLVNPLLGWIISHSTLEVKEVYDTYINDNKKELL